MKRWECTGKYKTANKILDVLVILMILSGIVITIMYYVKAPDIVPTHYNMYGEVDGYGPKGMCFINMAVYMVFGIALFFLGKNPQIYNYAVTITEENKEKQYNMASVFVRVMNIEVVGVMLYIQFTELVNLNSAVPKLSINFLPVELIVIFGSLGFYIYKSIKNK